MQIIGNEKLPTIVKDPFKKNKITSIIFHYSSGMFSPYEWSCTATVSFENGMSKGEQKFKTADFDSCVIQVREFVNSLDNA